MPSDKKKKKNRKKKKNDVSPSIEIREMELADLHPVFELGHRLFTAKKWPTLYRAWDEYEIMELYATDRELCLVAEANSKVVGFALGAEMEKPRSAWRYGWLLWLGVHPKYKRAGLGTRLVNRLTDLFIEREVRMMLVDTDAENKDAIAFFHRQGFGGAIHHVYLSRNLDDHPDVLEKRASSRVIEELVKGR
jgi:ribosomal protein S18 acetylase RimI-like enzyme